MLDTKSLFNESYYLAKNPAVASAVANGSFPIAFTHFSQFGQFEGRSPSALFDTNYYLLNNPDVTAAVNNKATTAIQHFITFGESEGRNPSAFYNNSYYLAKNPDVTAAIDRDEITGIGHFILFGESENRSPSPFYNDGYYLGKNPDVAAAVKRDEITGIEHYIKFGAAEAREVTPFIKSGDSTLPNGVAAGDTTQNSTVLWTRSTVLGNVVFEYSTDRNFGNILGTLTNTATDIAMPVKVQLTNLKAGTQYFYRVRDAAGTSAVGQFRTAAELGSRQGLRFGVAGDWQGQLTPFPAIANAPERNLDFFVRIGDSAYVDDLSPDLPGVRQPKTLEE
ncbi:MAG: PhoD-like phosphatase N-terminal domain-containing protein, partial [Microcoleus sp.]